MAAGRLGSSDGLDDAFAAGVANTMQALSTPSLIEEAISHVEHVQLGLSGRLTGHESAEALA